MTIREVLDFKTCCRCLDLSRMRAWEKSVTEGDLRGTYRVYSKSDTSGFSVSNEIANENGQGEQP
jgi:hypothetical protein